MAERVCTVVRKGLGYASDKRLTSEALIKKNIPGIRPALVIRRPDHSGKSKPCFAYWMQNA